MIPQGRLPVLQDRTQQAGSRAYCTAVGRLLQPLVVLQQRMLPQRLQLVLSLSQLPLPPMLRSDSSHTFYAMLSHWSI